MNSALTGEYSFAVCQYYEKKRHKLSIVFDGNAVSMPLIIIVIINNNNKSLLVRKTK